MILQQPNLIPERRFYFLGHDYRVKIKTASGRPKAVFFLIGLEYFLMQAEKKLIFCIAKFKPGLCCTSLNPIPLKNQISLPEATISNSLSISSDGPFEQRLTRIIAARPTANPITREYKPVTVPKVCPPAKGM